MWYLYVDGRFEGEGTWYSVYQAYESLSRERPKALITISERKRA